MAQRNFSAPIAALLFEEFEFFYQQFYKLSADAQVYFEQSDWLAAQHNAVERIKLYKRHVRQTQDKLTAFNHYNHLHTIPNQAVKTSYTELIHDHENFDIAESFYNSVYQSLFQHQYLDNRFLYIRAHRNSQSFDYQKYTLSYQSNNLPELLERLLSNVAIDLEFEDLPRDAIACSEQIRRAFPAVEEFNVLALSPIFYRNKAAYVVARIDHLQQSFPVILPLLKSEQGKLYVDAVLLDIDTVSILFSFTRSYFMLQTQSPRRVVNFLKSILPHKRDHELFTSIGCQKHGKTELYRDYLGHIQRSDDLFDISEGVKGMVMCVFTLPSYDFVFKLIKDSFTPPKEIDHKQVKAKYKLVKRHDRVGRMADTQEFHNFSIPLDRIAPDLLKELYSKVPSLLEESNGQLVIKHLYIERKMVPLNIYLKTATATQMEHILDEFGLTIKQLAAANIFPGDMLFKNFGVTRHQRVVFYDYDEISYLNECNFRAIPKSKYPEDAYSSEPWFSAGPMDIFPEEFATFLLLRPQIKEILLRLHPEIFDVNFWKGQQEILQENPLADIYPYNEKLKLKINYSLRDQQLTRIEKV